MAFYCSGSRKGFLATGTVVGPIFTSDKPLWFTGIYPVRIPIHVAAGPTARPIDPKIILRRVGQDRFQNAAPRKAIIPLTRAEFLAVEKSVVAAEPRSGEAGDLAAG